ncbi:MAG: tyrosine recombinase [Proteobacteria bacterium]|nr:tyrosine recombinase [Pseudomonadota bacterium]NBX86656.1 tyrosine recombinase [Pseudomonadota bacterium]
MSDVFTAFCEYLATARGASPHTLSAYKSDIKSFIQFIGGTANITHIGPQKVEDFLAALATQKGSPYSSKSKPQKPLKGRSLARKLTSLRQFYAFLLDRGWATHNPTDGIPLPKSATPLPKALSQQDIEKLINSPTGTTPQQQRLRLILQLLYATGLRVSELCSLTLEAVTEGEGLILRVTGKGQKTRLVPIGYAASATLTAYLQTARPHLKGHHGPWLFPAPNGKHPLTRQRIFQLIQNAGKSIGISVAPHHLRHTFASHLVANDADLRSVQLMLGHASLNTTQIYTKISHNRLTQTLEKHHPLSIGKPSLPKRHKPL